MRTSDAVTVYLKRYCTSQLQTSSGTALHTCAVISRYGTQCAAEYILLVPMKSRTSVSIFLNYVSKIRITVLCANFWAVVLLKVWSGVRRLGGKCDEH